MPQWSSAVVATQAAIFDRNYPIVAVFHGIAVRKFTDMIAAVRLTAFFAVIKNVIVITQFCACHITGRHQLNLANFRIAAHFNPLTSKIISLARATETSFASIMRWATRSISSP